MKKLFCFGYGYSCDHLGHYLLQKEGWSVAGTTRDPEKRRFLKAHGIKTFLFDYEHPLDDPALFLQNVTHLLISTPPDNEGDPAFLVHGDDIAALKNLEWVGYLSSTSVYGNHDGDWVDEKSEAIPDTIRGSRRARAEEQWMSLFYSHNVPVHVFRIAGIYGPGRSALDSVRAGIARRIDKPGHAFNRVHVDDIVQVLLASMNNPAPGEIYNISDDMASPSHEVIAYACELLGRALPPLIPYNEVDMAPIARSFYSDNKKVRNEKIKQDLGVELKYPDYRSGLKACYDAEEALPDENNDRYEVPGR